MRYVLFLFYLTVVSLIGLESALQGWYYIQNGTILFTREIQPSIYTQESLKTKRVLNPFLGYTFRPGWTPSSSTPLKKFLEHERLKEAPYFWDWSVNNYGFLAENDYPIDRDAYFVAIFGGSVANTFALFSRDDIIAAVRSAPGRENEDVVIINLASGGYKQPQQLLALVYFLAIGQQIDLVINMDGINEAYIGWDNWKRYEVEPSVPTAKFLFGLLNQFISSTNVTEAKSILNQLDKELASARFAIHHYITLARRQATQVDQFEIEAEIGVRIPGRVYPMAVQSREFASIDEYSDYVAELWARTSIQMKFVADSANAKYIHALQPSQYIGSRIFSLEEQKVAFSDPPWEGIDSVRATYPKMLQRVDQLRESGVEFVDLTRVFDGTQNLIYTDPCCHFHKDGYKIIMKEALASKIEAYSSE